MVLSSWHSHCESSPGSFNECRLSAEVATNSQTKPTDLDCESARKKWQLSSTSTIAILLLLSPRVDTHFTVPRKVEGWVDLGCRDKQLPVVRFEPLTPQSGMLPLCHYNTAVGLLVFLGGQAHLSTFYFILHHTNVRFIVNNYYPGILWTNWNNFLSLS